MDTQKLDKTIPNQSETPTRCDHTADISKKVDTIDRQAAIDALVKRWVWITNFDNIGKDIAEECKTIINGLPSARPEPLTDKEQRIYLSAMEREEIVCKQYDDKHRNCREPYEDSLVRICHEITRKVKGALWTT